MKLMTKKIIIIIGILAKYAIAGSSQKSKQKQTIPSSRNKKTIPSTKIPTPKPTPGPVPKPSGNSGGSGGNGGRRAEPSPPVGPQMYFESQSGALCGRHALNNVLQGRFFSTNELNQKCAALKNEHHMMGQETVHLCTPAGYYNSQVLSKSLKELDITMTDLHLPAKLVHGRQNEALRESFNRDDHIGFIAGNTGHWFAYRRFGDVWIEMNKDSGAKALTESAFLQQFNDGLTDVFEVRGKVPEAPHKDIGSGNAKMIKVPTL